MLNYKKTVQAVIGTALEELGFEKEKFDRYSYSYSRKKESVIQSIIVLRNPYEKNSVKVIFQTNAYGQKQKEFEDFVPGVLQDEWKYETADEFIAIMQQFKEWILQYGLDILEQISIPTSDVCPKPETNRYLYEHHEELNEQYRIMLQINETDEKRVVLQKLYQEVRRLHREVEFQEAERELIGIAAVYAHTLCLFGKGQWTWDDTNSMCVIHKIAGTMVNLFPLSMVIAEYKVKDRTFKEWELDTFTRRYHNTLCSYNLCVETGSIRGELIDIAQEIYGITEEEDD